MKNLVLILGFMFLSLVGFSQRLAPIDTLQGNETVNFSNLLNATAIQAVCTELGGTSDGTLRLQASLDGTNFNFVTETAGVYEFYPNDTLTITDGAVWLVNLENSPFPYHRIVGAGTASDTTEVTITYRR
jgi:hypothetical protein